MTCLRMSGWQRKLLTSGSYREWFNLFQLTFYGHSTQGTINLMEKHGPRNYGSYGLQHKMHQKKMDNYIIEMDSMIITNMLINKAISNGKLKMKKAYAK